MNTIIYLKVNRHFALYLSLSLSLSHALSSSLSLSPECMTNFFFHIWKILPIVTFSLRSTGIVPIFATMMYVTPNVTSWTTTDRGRLSVAKRARDDIRNDNPPSQLRPAGRASCRDSLEAIPGWRPVDFGPSLDISLPPFLLPSLYSIPKLCCSFPAPWKTSVIYTLRM